MSEKKVIFIDVDGTLLDYENKLPESAVKAIHEARKNGYRVYICTGRSEGEVYDYIWDIGLDGMIGGNGSYVKDGKDIILDQHISAEQERHIVDWCHANNLEFYLESNSGLYASENFEERGNPTVSEYCRRKGKENASSLKVRDVFPEMIFGADLYRDDINKVSFILNSYQDHLDSVKEFPDLKVGTWGGAGEIALFGDMGVANISKAYAIDRLLKHLNTSIEDTYAFGDAKIDIPMLEYCGTGIAMGSGGDECKEAADYVTDDVDNDGLYNAFVHFGLIGGEKE